MSSDGGSNYVTIRTFSSADNLAGPESIDISSYIASNTVIRFYVSDGAASNRSLYFDDVDISYSSTATGGSTAFSTVSDTASLTVTSANDAGTFGGDTSGSGAEDGGAITGTLTFTDAIDGASAPNFTVTGAASSGSASIDSGTGAWSYTPGADFHGTDSFTVTVTDDDGHSETQVISLTVTSANDAGTFGGDTSGSGAEDGGAITGTLTAEAPPEPGPSMPEPISDSTAEPIERGPPPLAVQLQAQLNTEPTGESLADATDTVTAPAAQDEPSVTVLNVRLPEPLDMSEGFLGVLADPQRPDFGSKVQKAAQPLVKPTVENAQTLVQELRSFWKGDNIAASIELFDVKSSKAFWNDLDKMARDLDEAIDEDDKKTHLSAEAVAGVGISLTAGFVSWALRTGAMASSFLATMSTWRHFDPMPILSDDEARKDIAADDAEDDERIREVDDLFER